MAYSLRFLSYIVGGGVLLAWVDPPQGPVRWAAILLYIVVAAYLDTLVHRTGRRAGKPRAADGVIKMEAYRAVRRKPAAEAKPERRSPRPMFSTTDQSEAEDLLALLRRKGLNPIMVTRRMAGDNAPVEFEVRLPERELPKAKSLMSQYIARKSAPLN